MYVFSYLELHTTLIGWILYDLLWLVLAESGLVALPFLWILFQHWRDATSKQDTITENNHTESKVLFIKLAIAFLVLLFVALPLTTLQPTTVTFSPQPSFSDSSPEEVTAVTDTSTYQQNLGITSRASAAQVPLWWRAVMGISSGITNAVVQNLPVPGDLREAQVLLSSNNIEQPDIAHEYRSFIQNCYVPAKNRFEDWAIDGRIDTSDVDAEDIDWAGSSYLLTLPGGYAACPGGLAGLNSCGSTIHPPPGIRGLGENATCADWWRLLENDIYEADSENDGFWENMTDNVNLLSSFSEPKMRAARVKGLLNNMVAGDILVERKYGETGFFSGMWGMVEDVTGAVTTGNEALARSVFVNIMKQAVPITMAIILLVVYFMLPAALVFTLFSIEAVVAFTFVIFSLIFTHALFAVASWLDYNLIVSLFDDFTMLSWLSSDGGHLLGNAQKRWLINITVGMLYVVMPMAWLYVMGIAGLGAARATGFLVGTAPGGDGAASAAAGVAKNAATKGSKAAATRAKASFSR